MGAIQLGHIELNIKNKISLKIMVFNEGTVLGPKSIFHLFSHSKYAPIKNSTNILQSWDEQGAEIVYLTSRKKEKQVSEIVKLLYKYNFPGKRLYYRDKGQKYSDLVELYAPNILIEDDCRSIGGAWQMSITYVKPELKARIKSIVVPEFRGIDDLPKKLSELIHFSR